MPILVVYWLVGGFLNALQFGICEEAPQDLCTEGCKQSPIDISSYSTEEVELPPIVFNNHWNPDLSLYMVQGGNTVIIKANDDDEPISVEGGPLQGTFLLDQLHFHWGTELNNGTEHSLEKCKYAMEAHLVYYNCIFGCAQRAIGQLDGIAIIAVLMESKPTYHNSEFDAIVSNLFKLSCPGVSIPVPTNVLTTFEDVLTSREYFAYDGSLTTPPCCEEVTWLVFKRVVCINCNQVKPFRKVCNEAGVPICHNCRDIQPLNGRIIIDVTSACPTTVVPEEEISKRRKLK